VQRRFVVPVTLVLSLLAALLVSSAPANATTNHLRRVFVIMMENNGFDDVIGHDNAQGQPDTPYITYLATHYGLSTYYFGVTHPSLPNYLAFISGDTFGIQDDNPSCYAQPPQSPCDVAKGANIVDRLEQAHLTWEVFEQTMPHPGYLGPQFPTNPNGPVLYAQKHNPFVYFKDIAQNPARRARIVGLSNTFAELRSALSSSTLAPNFNFIVPDQCHDMHGTSTCSNYDSLLMAGDQYVKALVNVITHSAAYTPDSAIVITWDENDYSSNLGCCLSPPIGGGHVAAIVITPRYRMPMESALPSNHYTTLRSILGAFNLPALGKSAYLQPNLFDLLP